MTQHIDEVERTIAEVIGDRVIPGTDLALAANAAVRAVVKQLRAMPFFDVELAGGIIAAYVKEAGIDE